MGERVKMLRGLEAGGAAEAPQGLRATCHDMQQPVASLFALAGAALAEPGLPEAARASLEQIVHQAEWLAELIEHSLQAADPRMPDARLADVLRVTCEAVGAERLTWAGEIRIVPPARPVLAAVPPDLLRRMVANLLSNATRAAGGAGVVTVEIGRQQGSALVAVEDTGPGFGNIPPGFGIGLTAVSGLATRYGGGLEHGRGASGRTRVTLCLPLT